MSPASQLPSVAMAADGLPNDAEPPARRPPKGAHARKVPAVRAVVPEDVPELSACLARAFYDDPVSVFLFPGKRTQLRRLERYFRWQLRNVFLPKGEVWTTEDLAGASLWMLAGRRQPTFVEALAQLATVVTILGPQTVRAFRLLEQLELRHPKQPHCYLGTIGTDPDRQGTGVGSALMSVVLDRLDEEGMPAYLESSKEENLSFYHRHGFEVTGEIDSVRDCPKLWLMWRKPRTPSGPLFPLDHPAASPST